MTTIFRKLWIFYHKDMTETSNDILKTLAYFDLFEMPLTQQELEAYFYTPNKDVPDSEVINTSLEQLRSSGRIDYHEGHYFLPNRPFDLVSQRQERRQRSEKILYRASLWLKLLSWWPGVLMIAICNNVAKMNASPNSDIDLVVVTKPERIWQTRFFLTSLLYLFGKRPTPNNSSEKLCLSFFCTVDRLAWHDVVLGDDDIDFAYWLAFMRPVYDPHAIMPQLRYQNRDLFHQSIPFTVEQKLFNYRFGHFGCWLEKLTKRWQKKRMPKLIMSVARENPKHVVLSDTMLKLHTNDRRAFYCDEWKKRWSQPL